MSGDLKSKSTRAAGVVSIAIMCSRVLGLVREQVFAAMFGADRSLDAFIVAFRTPNMLRDLFAEGALSMAFVTTFSKKIENEGDQSAWQLANKVATLLTVVLSAIVLIGIAIAPWLVAIMAPGFDPEKAALTVMLARIMYPFILLVSLAALVMGMLNAKSVFGMPALASSFFNISMILVGSGLGYWLDPELGPRALIGLAVGALVGGAAQLLVQFPSLIKVGYRFRPDFMWRDKGVKQVLTLMGPAVVAASAVQVNVLVNTIFASWLEDGSVSWINISFRLVQLPIGVFGVAIATVTLPLISKSMAGGRTDEFRDVLSRGLRLALLLTVPAAVGLWLLSEPIISLIYQHGNFTVRHAMQTAGALQYYAIGLVAYSLLKVLTPAFYAMDKKKTPMIISFLAIGTNLFLNWLFTFKLGMAHRGLALSTGCVAVINFVILYGLMSQHTHGLHGLKLIGTAVRIAMASAVLGTVCLVSKDYLLADWATMALIPKTVYTLGTIGVAAGAFFVTAYLLKVEEMSDVVAMVMRRLRRG